MSFLAEKSINPHILLYALSLPPNSTLQETPLRRLNLLARTRQFDAIEATVSIIKDISFPTLPNSTFRSIKNSPSPKRRVNPENNN